MRRSRSFALRPFSRSVPPRQKRCSERNGVWQISADECILIKAFRWSSPTIRPLFSATPTGRNRPGMTSASPDSLLTAEPALRSAPWSPEAEQAVLGAMMLDQDAALRAAELLDHSLFYREAHRRLFRAMVALTEQRTVIDHVTLRDELIRRNELDSAGGMD